MLDDELKKLLHDLKMDDVVRELEGDKKVEVKEDPVKTEEVVVVAEKEPEPLPPTPQKKHTSNKTVLLIGALLVALIPTAYCFWPRVQQESNLIAYNDENDDEDDEENDLLAQREAQAAAWATKIVQIDPQTGTSVHELWEMLRRRKEDLEDVAQELTNLLYDNAHFREDYYAKTSEVLLSRYLAVDHRHALEIASQMRAIYAQIKEKNNSDLSRAYAEMLAELGAESYTKRYLEIAKELLEQEKQSQAAPEKF